MPKAENYKKECVTTFEAPVTNGVHAARRNMKNKSDGPVLILLT